MSQTKIAISNLSHRFEIDGREMLALADISLEVDDGEFVAIIGPSGCGKSTLLNIISGLFAPSTGRVTVDGRPVTGLNPRIGYMFARDALLPWRTALANVEFGLELRGAAVRERRERARELLRVAGLQGFEASYPSQLSQGMRQRLSLARATLNDPKVLLLDEPFSNLDPQSSKAMSRLLGQMRDNKPLDGLLLVLHGAMMSADPASKWSRNATGRQSTGSPIRFSNPSPACGMWSQPTAPASRSHA